MFIGYNTNGFAHHRIEDALAIISELGYRSVALTLQRRHLDPPESRGVAGCVRLLRPAIAASGLRVTIETGARFVLDPRRKHQPTLLSGSSDCRQRRLAFLKAAVDVSAELKADSVSLWSGAPDDLADEPELWDRLVLEMGSLLDHAERRRVRLSFEPEPGMFIDTMAKYGRLHTLLLHHPCFGLTLDVGHACCLDDGEFGAHVSRWKDVLWNVHVEDMRHGLHDHLMFGEGDIDFDAVFKAFRTVDYRGPVHVELSRHSHDAVETARRAYAFLGRYTGVADL